MLGFFLNLVITSIFTIFAHMFIGPAVILALNAVGLIVLAIGAAYILKEKLNATEYIGIAFMIIGICIFGFAQLFVDNSVYDYSNTPFLIRISIFTGIFTIAVVFCDILRKQNSIIHAVESGLLFSMTGIWMSVMITTIGRTFTSNASTNEIILFTISCFVLPGTNYFGIVRLQQAYVHGQATNLRIIQLIPIQIVPIIYFYLIYQQISPQAYSWVFAFVGILLILGSGYILSKRELQLRNIK
jgi:hypothetical protein